MDGEEWIGAQISWRVHNGDELDLEFEGQIDTAEDIGDGIVRIAGALSTGRRFVLVTDDAGLN
jgi:hypothetical protein